MLAGKQFTFDLVSVEHGQYVKGTKRGKRPRDVVGVAAMTRYGRKVATNRPAPSPAVMTDDEKLDLRARLAAYEMLLTELLIVLYAQKGYGNRRLNFRKRMEQQFSDVIQDGEGHPVEIYTRRKAIYENVIAAIYTAVNRLPEEKRPRGRSE